MLEAESTPGLEELDKFKKNPPHPGLELAIFRLVA
jgi:hypothetical protein